MSKALAGSFDSSGQSRTAPLLAGVSFGGLRILAGGGGETCLDNGSPQTDCRTKEERKRLLWASGSGCGALSFLANLFPKN